MYRFEITVIVTDITGETHEATKSLVLNQQGYEINISLRERISIQGLKSIEVTATNSDGADVKVNGEVEISAIKGPSQNRRNRLWTAPDILTLSEQEYASRFADYAVPGREEMAGWTVDRVVGKKSFTVEGASTLDFSN
jgi:hypothetical protein